MRSARLHNVKETCGIGRRRMPLLPDLGLAALYGLVVFLLALGFLVVFVESISMRRLLAALVLTVIVAAGLVSNGEPGLSLLALGVAGGVISKNTLPRATPRPGRLLVGAPPRGTTAAPGGRAGPAG